MGALPAVVACAAGTASVSPKAAVENANNKNAALKCRGLISKPSQTGNADKPHTTAFCGITGLLNY